MLGRLNHVAIAVRDAEQAAKIYGKAFGADISAAVPLPEHGVITVFVTLPNTKIEFIQPLGEASRVLGDGQPKIGAHGKPVLFFHPKDFSGALVEIEQA